MPGPERDDAREPSGGEDALSGAAAGGDDLRGAASAGETEPEGRAPEADRVEAQAPVEPADAADDDLNIELGPIEVSERHARPPDPGRVVALGRPGWPWLVRLWWPALMKVLAHTAEKPDTEVAGLLVGSVANPGGRVNTFIWDTVVAGELPASAVEVTMTHEAWRESMEQVWRREDGAGVVGWYHSHPGFGVFMSGADCFIAEHFFGHPGHVSLVYDNRRRQVGVFCRHGERIRAFQGVQLALARQAADLDWQRLRYSGERSPLQKLAAWLLRRPGAPSLL